MLQLFVGRSGVVLLLLLAIFGSQCQEMTCIRDQPKYITHYFSCIEPCGKEIKVVTHIAGRTTHVRLPANFAGTCVRKRGIDAKRNVALRLRGYDSRITNELYSVIQHNFITIV